MVAWVAAEAVAVGREVAWAVAEAVAVVVAREAAWAVAEAGVSARGANVCVRSVGQRSVTSEGHPVLRGYARSAGLQ